MVATWNQNDCSVFLWHIDCQIVLESENCWQPAVLLGGIDCGTELARRKITFMLTKMMIMKNIRFAATIRKSYFRVSLAFRFWDLGSLLLKALAFWNLDSLRLFSVIVLEHGRRFPSNALTVDISPSLILSISCFMKVFSRPSGKWQTCVLCQSRD